MNILLSTREIKAIPLTNEGGYIDDLNICKVQARKIREIMWQHVKAEPGLPPRWVADMLAEIDKETT
jgi:hypothetical protein